MESFLSSCIPDLEFNSLSLQFDRLDLEINPCSLSFFVAPEHEQKQRDDTGGEIRVNNTVYKQGRVITTACVNPVLPIHKLVRKDIVIWILINHLHRLTRKQAHSFRYSRMTQTQTSLVFLVFNSPHVRPLCFP